MVKQRSDWTAADVAAHAMEATSLSQLTLPEVKRLAARVLADGQRATGVVGAGAKPSPSWDILRGIRDDVKES